MKQQYKSHESSICYQMELHMDKPSKTSHLMIVASRKQQMKTLQARSSHSINVLNSQTSRLQLMNIDQHEIHTQENESRDKILHTSFPQVGAV